MSSLSENRDRLKFFLLDENGEEQDEERSGLIHRLKNISSKEVAVVDIPAVGGASFRTIKNESGQAEQLSLEGLEVSNMSNEELKELVTDLETDEESTSSTEEEAVVEEENSTEDSTEDENVKTDGENESSSFFEGVYSHLDELSTQNNELESQNKLLRDELSKIRSQVDKNTESITTFSLVNDESESGEEETQVESEPVEDGSVVSMEQIVEMTDKLNQSATEIRELLESCQISQEQFDEDMTGILSGFKSLETIASEVA